MSNTPTGLDLDEILNKTLQEMWEVAYKAGSYFDYIQEAPSIQAEFTQALTRWGLEQRIDEVESFKRALDRSEINFEFEDARETLIVRNAVKAAWGVMKPQLEEQCDDRITQLQANLQDGGTDGDSK